MPWRGADAVFSQSDGEGGREEQGVEQSSDAGHVAWVGALAVPGIGGVEEEAVAYRSEGDAGEAQHRARAVPVALPWVAPRWAPPEGMRVREPEDDTQVGTWWAKCRLAQRRDAQVLPWIRFLESEGVIVPDDPSIRRKVLKEHADYVLIEEVLHRYCAPRARGEGTPLLVVPTELRAELMRFVHDDPRSGGHFSLEKALAKARARWFWWGMRADLARWISSCIRCQHHQYRRGRHAASLGLQLGSFPRVPGIACTWTGLVHCRRPKGVIVTCVLL